MAKNRKKWDSTYEEKRAGQRTRNWNVIFFIEDLPENWINLVNELHIKWIQSPLHDKDFNPDGSPKKPHHHALFMFENVKTLEQVEKMFKEIFGESETGSIIGIPMPEKTIDRCGTVRYMAHLDNPEKVQYDISQIVGHNGADPSEILRYSASETREMIIAMEEYIEQNNIVELVDFSKAIRYTHPEWHTIVATKMTVYFNAFIRSNRHKSEKQIKVIKINNDGEIIDGDKKEV